MRIEKVRHKIVKNKLPIFSGKLIDVLEGIDFKIIIIFVFLFIIITKNISILV